MRTERREAQLAIDGRTYTLWVNQRVVQPPEAPRLVIVSYQPNRQARDILRVCIQALQRYTPVAHELWVVDNNSPLSNAEALLEWPRLNVVLNRTEPLPPHRRSLWRRLSRRNDQRSWGSYANAIALELAVRLVDPQSHYFMTLHMDTLPCRIGWLSFLRSKLGPQIAASGVRSDTTRTPEGVLHVLGYIVDFQLFRKLGLDFLPALPRFDVGDRVTAGLRAAGYTVAACRNTLWEPQLVESIPLTSPLRHLHVDRALDEDGNVIFLHLGRGVMKSSGGVKTGTSPEAWIKFADEYLLA